MNDTTKITFWEKEGVDVPSVCSNNHELKEDTTRIETCKMTGRKRWRCRECAREYTAASRERRNNYLSVITDALDEEIIGRANSLARRLSDVSSRMMLREIVIASLDEIENTLNENKRTSRN